MAEGGGGGGGGLSSSADIDDISIFCCRIRRVIDIGA